MPFQWLQTTSSFTPSSTASCTQRRCKDFPVVPPKESLPEGGLQNGPSGASEAVQCAAVKSGGFHVTLQIVPERVDGGEGGPEIETSVFADNSSDTILCLSNLAESLGISRKPVHFLLSSINAENIPNTGYRVTLTVLALKSDDPILLDKVWTVDHLPISKRRVHSDEDTMTSLEGHTRYQDLKETKRPLAYL